MNDWKEVIPTSQEMKAIREMMQEQEIIPGVTDRFIIENWDWPVVDRSWIK